MEKISVSTNKRNEFLEITPEIEKFVEKSGIKQGICFLYIPHTTCGLTINENADPSVKRDILDRLEEIVPENSGYTHTEGNSDAHIKSSILGHSLFVFIENGLLKLGTWQGIFLCEFDGPRIRQIWIKVVEC